MVTGSSYSTSSFYFHQIWEVNKVLEKQSSTSDLVISTMVKKMKEKLQKYWDLSYVKICIPVILDPRCKFRLNEWFGEEAFNYLYEVKKAFRNLFAEYSSKFNDPILEKAQTGSSSEVNVDEDNPWSDWRRHQSALQKRRLNELDKYLEEETMDIDVHFDILQY
ncbi:LOW QUALITY PROTEIN: hypothetical protein U9M48_033226 [Paspalum notatum var. saurae]|uniref:hAT-like transposase RNase-H fold domain-containing protein n=1 Tax=Paspalum notatum var. saurae TaxID=547442 RepID=A0AAQ3X6F6_PASNO